MLTSDTLNVIVLTLVAFKFGNVDVVAIKFVPDAVVYLRFVVVKFTAFELANVDVVAIKLVPDANI